MNAGAIAGGCYCGAVRFTAWIGPDAATFRCNCSICTKSRSWLTTVAEAEFRLDAGSDEITAYRFGAGIITHCFCRRCGVKTHGLIAELPDAPAQVAVSVPCLDLGPADLAAFFVACVDGREDRQDRAPAINGYL